MEQIATDIILLVSIPKRYHRWMTNLGGDPWFVSLLTHLLRYCESNVLHGHEISWYDDDMDIMIWTCSGTLVFVDFQIKHTSIKLN